MEKAYTVLKIDSLVRPSDTQGMETYYRIRYKTKGGVTDFAEFDEKDYTEENVDVTLTKLAQKHDKILKL